MSGVIKHTNYIAIYKNEIEDDEVQEILDDLPKIERQK